MISEQLFKVWNELSQEEKEIVIAHLDKQKTVKQMEIKTAKIKEIKHISPWSGNGATIYYHHLVMDNGDQIDIGKKSECKVGWELTYKLIGDPGQQEFTKAKSEKKPDGNFFQQKNMNGKGQASFALAYAKDYAGFYINQGRDYTPEQVIETAGKFNQWLKSNS